jgi:hypothetical protein
MAYKLRLTEEEIETIGFVGGRYCWSDSLLALDVGENVLAEHEAWAIKEAIEADMEGGHDAFPMLDTRSDVGGELADKLMALLQAIV